MFKCVKKVERRGEVRRGGRGEESGDVYECVYECV